MKTCGRRFWLETVRPWIWWLIGWLMSRDLERWGALARVLATAASVALPNSGTAASLAELLGCFDPVLAVGSPGKPGARWPGPRRSRARRARPLGRCFSWLR